MADDTEKKLPAVGPEQRQQPTRMPQQLLPGEKLLVTVEAALPDILVVSLQHAGKSFQGALLDATKRGLPCGVEPPEPIKGPDSDELSTIAARFSYFQEKRHTSLSKSELRRTAHPPARSKNSRPTVRLRPRQVLCSKCRSICNENSENVGRKRKAEEPSRAEPPPRRSDRRCSSQQRQQQQPAAPAHQPQQHTRSNTRLSSMADHSDESCSSKTTTASSSSHTERSSNFTPSLIPKLSRLRPGDIGKPGSLKPCIKLAEQVRSAYWSGRDEEDLSQGQPGENPESSSSSSRPANGLSGPEPVELDSNPSQEYCATPRRLSSSSVESAKVPPEEDEARKTLAAADSTSVRPPPAGGSGRALRAQRKKRSIGLMEDLWDESVFEEPAAAPSAGPAATTGFLATTTTPTARATPVIKISFGAQGEGTVLKIPSKIQHPAYLDTDTEEAHTEPERESLKLIKKYDGYCMSGYEEDPQEQVDPQKLGMTIKDCDSASSKAAKKALKKAKKKALRKMYGAASPARSPCNGSPRYSSNLDKIMYHRRKHKVKHKKRHKEERRHRSQSSHAQPDCSVLRQPDCLDIRPDEPTALGRESNEEQESSAYTAIKEQCLKQKLSISLKRLNTNAYAARCEHHHSYPVSNASSGCKSSGATSDEDEEEEEEEDEDGESSCMGSSEHEVNGAETAPDFPPTEHPLVMRLAAAATPVEHCLTSNGRRMDVGDVVWGKVHGFPWWPGKVLSITDSRKEDGTVSEPQAHVAWYGSSTSSLMSCDQLSPFLETFKTRYNKKKKGPYKEAIRQAQSEARSQIALNSTSSVLDVCGSPREVNVLS